MLDKILEWFPEEEILKADGFDDAIIGIDDTSMRLIYSVNKCIEILVSEEDLNEFTLKFIGKLNKLHLEISEEDSSKVSLPYDFKENSRFFM